MWNPVLYRKRLIPDELILLKDDVILYSDEDMLVTKWNALRPKIDLDHGISCYYLKRGYKVSKLFRKDGSLLYYYCDIVTYDMSPVKNELLVTDLLADVIIMPDGFIKVVDLEELSEALKSGIITVDQLQFALDHLSELLYRLYEDGLEDLAKPILKYEKR